MDGLALTRGPGARPTSPGRWPDAGPGELLDRAADALPAAEEQVRHGWRLRHAGEGPWWSGATLAHGGVPDAGLASGVAAVEAFYADRAAPALVQVCPGCPSGLDGELAGRGWRRHGSTLLQVAGVSADPPRQVLAHGSEQPTAAWWAVRGPDADVAAERRALARVTAPSWYVTAHLDGGPVAVGRAVADRGWAGVFGMATLPAARRRGAGRAVLAALAGWAAARGCRGLYLQVEERNAAAGRLYARAGFGTLARYHYRSHPRAALPRCG
ncbi:GNAT family N-acetyltransferase [Goekera deserti]|uniref:GNAT family N-acetyltransferase n=1 Tax=Goekera deserti TaxID=2497753 RepID=UPI00192E8C43|nr:GNAT family N-acetyltransferase [Goekera deserti]